MKRYGCIMMFLAFALTAKGQMQFYRLYIDPGVQSSYYKHNATLGLMLEYKKSPRLPRFFKWDTSAPADTVKYLQKSKERKHTINWAYGAGAEWFFDNSWLLDVRFCISAKRWVKPIYTSISYYEDSYFGMVHYKFSPLFNRHYICPEVGIRLWATRISVSYYIPLTQQERWYTNFFLAVRIPLTLYKIDPTIRCF